MNSENAVARFGAYPGGRMTDTAEAGSFADTALPGVTSADAEPQGAANSNEIRIVRGPKFRTVTAWRGKRAMDIVLSLLALPAALVIGTIGALLIYASTGGPVFFTQARTGLNGRTFRMYKLRTMSDGGTGTRPTLENDPRVTPIGAVLRKYRIDELPQIINVLKGDMSIIGPRPEQPHLVAEYRHALPGFDNRHLVKPGITGLAQVRYQYAADAAETRNKLRYDIIYVRKQSARLDLWVIMQTVGVIMRGFGSR